MPSADRPQLLSVEEVAGYLGVHRDTVTTWCRSGRIPAVKLGHRWYIRQDRIESLLTPEASQ